MQSHRVNSAFMHLFISLWLVLGLGITGCKPEPNPIPDPDPDPVDTTQVKKSAVSIWRTFPDGIVTLALDPTVHSWKSAPSGTLTLEVDSTQTMQTMDGFGAAVTGSSAHVIMQLPENQRNQLLKDLFHPGEGIGLSFIRVTIGSSDFSVGSYTYLDSPDTTLQSFSFGKDADELIPVLKAIKALRPDIRIMATPWSAPAWMKTSQNLNGGSLAPAHYRNFARYLVKYLQRMEAEGLPVYALSVQNEPEHTTPNYPSMSMTAAEQLVFIRDHLRPAFLQAALTTQVLVFDHNWDNTQFPRTIFSDPVAGPFVAGAAYHCYAGDVSAMSVVRNAHPDKGLWFTECSGGDWAPNFGDNLRWNTSNLIIGAPRNWAKGVLLWNLALDPNDGPQNGGCSNCRGVVTVTGTTWQTNVEYFLLAHAAKHVLPGSVRIGSSASSSQLGHVAYRRPDGKFALVAMNYGTVRQEISLKVGDKYLNWTLDPGVLATMVWPR